MACQECITNYTLEIMDRKNFTDPSVVEHIHYIFDQILLPIVCIFGIVGNILNLAVLTRKQLQISMDRLEKSSHLGLVALAVSDLLFCLCAVPYAFLDRKKYVFYSSEPLFFMYYKIGSTAVLNTFLECSTWLTVVMATARYLAICRPLHARSLIDLTATRISIVTVFFLSILVNLPWFWQHEILKFQCSRECTRYTVILSELFMFNEKFEYTYSILWAVIGVFIPIIIQSFCNICLIRALRQSMNMQRRYRVNRPKQDSGHHITPTLIVIIILFMTLVIPSEIIKFAMFIVEKQGLTMQPAVKQAIASAMIITNFLQVCNFAVNFVLYCILNVHFRKTIAYFLCCKWNKKKQLSSQKSNQTVTTTLITEDTDL